MHDTEIDGIEGETIRYGGLYNNLDGLVSRTNIPKHEILKGLLPAIDEFLNSNTDWIMHEQFKNNNGLTILKKI